MTNKQYLHSLHSQINAILEFNDNDKQKWTVTVPAYDFLQKKTFFSEFTKEQKLHHIVSINPRIYNFFNSPNNTDKDVTTCAIYILSLYHLGDKRITLISIDDQTKHENSFKHITNNSKLYYSLSPQASPKT